MRLRKAPEQPPTRPQEALSASESAEPAWEPLFPTKRVREAPSGLIVVSDGLTAEEKKQRRADNKRMKEIHSKVRRRKRHGRR